MRVCVLLTGLSLKKNTTCVVAACQTNVLLLWRAIFDRAIWRVISMKLNIELEVMTLNPKKSLACF